MLENRGNERMEWDQEEYMNETRKHVMESSSDLCLEREALINTIAKLNKETEDHFLSERDYINQKSNIGPASCSAYLGVTIAVFGCSMFLLANVFPASRIWRSSNNIMLDVLTASFIIALFIWLAYRIIKKRRAKSSAVASYKEYKRQHEEFLKQKEIKEQQIRECSASIADITATLHTLIPLGGIPEDYWPDAYILKHLIEIGRADSLKEAINLWEEEKRWDNIVGELNYGNEMLRRQAKELKRIQQQQVAMMEEIRYEALKTRINDDMNMVAILLSK